KRRAPRGDGRSERVCEVCATVGEGKEGRILLIGSDNPWRMEKAIERARQRAGHTTLLIDDRRMKRLIGWKLTQLWARWQANQFAPGFVFLSKCLSLESATCRTSL